MKRLVFIILGLTWAVLSIHCQKSVGIESSATFIYETNKQVTPIALQATDQNLSLIVKRAFRLHGGFKVVPANSARYLLRFEGRGASGVLLTILPTGGAGARESFPEDF